MTPRQIQDFKNGFTEGYREARHGETNVPGRPASSEAAEGIRLGLLAGARHKPGDNSAKTIEDAVATWTRGGGHRVRESGGDAELAGERYADDQTTSEYFMDWAREQLLEASRMSPEDVLPLETKADALVIAKNMLQQLEWDTKHRLDNRELASLLGVDDVTRDDHTAFYSGFRKALDSSRDWLADSLLEIERGMRGGGVEETSSARTRHVPSKRLTRSTAKPGMHVRVVDGDSMYRGEVGTIVEPDVRRLNKLDDFNRRFLKGEGAVLVERRNGSLFTIHARALERENENPIDRRRLTAGARRSLKPRRYSDEQVRAMLAQVPMYREQLLTAAKERGWDRPSVVPITEVHAFLRAQLAASGVSEARRGRAQPLVDTKLYSVTWTGGRQGNLTDREAVDLVRQLRNDWVETGRSGLLNIQVWYRDGSLVPYADLERRLDVLHRI